MQRTVLILIAAFLMTLAAGGVLGRIATPVSKAPVSGPDGGWLAQQLQLSPEQRTQVQTIWDQTHTDVATRLGQRRDIDRQFQQNLLNLLNDQQKIQYRALRDQATARYTSIDSEMKGVIDTSIERTKAILKPEQREKYEQLLARFPSNQSSDSGIDHLSASPGSIELALPMTP